MQQGQVSATPADGFILGIGRFDSTKFVVNNWFMAASLLIKQSREKTKSCVGLKDCLNIIYGKIIWIFSRPCTSSLYVAIGERLYGNPASSSNI